MQGRLSNNIKDYNQQAFFALLRAGLWEQEVRLSQFEGIDFNEIYRLAEEQSIVGLVAAGLNNVTDTKIPKIDFLQFLGVSMHLEDQNKAMNSFIADLIEKLRKAGIYALLVKGQGIAQCYERPLWRSCGDVDLFLSEENYEKAKAFLKPLATSVESEYKYAKHLGMTIDPWVVELHGSLRGGLSNRINSVLDDIKRDTFNGGNARSWENDGVLVLLMGVENDIAYVFAHFLNHFYKEGVGLRQICDWCRLLWTYRKTLDVQKLEHRIRRMGLLTEWRAFGAYAVDYLGMPLEAMPFFEVKGLKDDGRCKIDDRMKRKARLINDFILSVGNMGHNRDMSYFSKYPFMKRKCISMVRRISDLVHHMRIFPLNTLRYFPTVIFGGLKSAARGEG